MFMEDGSPIGLSVLFILCLLASFYFSGAEMAFVSVNRIRMRSHADNGNRQAKRVLIILDQFDKALTTLLIGNNIANISCATITTALAAQFWRGSSVAVVALCTTAIIFLLAESLPKAFAKACNERYAMVTAGSLLFLMKVFSPLSQVFTALSNFVSKPFAAHRQGEPTVTEHELFDIIEDALEEGALDEETGELVHSAIEYTNATVRDILTPWKDVLKLSLGAPPETTLRIIRENNHSRLPVIDETGKAVGLLNIRKYLKATLREGTPPDLATSMDTVHTVRDTMPIDDLLPEMSNKRTHFTIIQDEWENVLGVVTIEDMLETLVGEIYDEDDVEEGGEANAQ